MRRESPRWRGHDRQHARRVCSPDQIAADPFDKLRAGSAATTALALLVALAHFVRSATVEINMDQPSCFAPDGDNQRLFLGPFRHVKEIPFPRLAVIW